MKKIKNNAEFIKEYGKFEFREMCKIIPQDLAIAHINKDIGGYKINNTKKIVKFYINNSESICLDFATIFTLGCEHINYYIKQKGGYFNEKS